MQNDAMQKFRIKALEHQNIQLKAEVERLRKELGYREAQDNQPLLDKADRYCRQHGVKYVDATTLKNWKG